jgi:hypothetical protein
MKALGKAKLKHPTKLFYLKRIGYKTAYFAGFYNEKD